MTAPDRERTRMRVIIPVFLQSIGYEQKHQAIFTKLAQRALIDSRDDPYGFVIQHPWIRWQGLASYLGCVEYARHHVLAIPTGDQLNITHAIPAQYHVVSLVLFSQALADNLAVWLSDSLPLGASGGDQNFQKGRFARELRKCAGKIGADLLQKHKEYLDDLNSYRQIWVHRRQGGGSLMTTEAPDDPSAIKQFGIPIEPAFDFFGENSAETAKKIAKKNGGRYVYSATEFAGKIANGANELFFDVLSLSLDYVPT